MGENISAKGIEDLLHRRPSVGDAAVIGLPDGERGERVRTVLELPTGARSLILPEAWGGLGETGLSVRTPPEQLEIVEALLRNERLRKMLTYQRRERCA